MKSKTLDGYWHIIVFLRTLLICGALTSQVSVSNAAIPPVPDFQILTLTTNNSLVVDHDALTGDDRAGIAASSTRVFYTGDISTARFQLTNLSGGTALGAIYDVLVTDLMSERVYSLADANGVLTAASGTATRLLEHDGTTGALNGNSVTLSLPVPLGHFGGNTGIFAGYGRVVVHDGIRVYDILLPSGVVTDLGPMSVPAHLETESGAFWGVAEQFGGTLYMAYVRDSQTIVRTAIPAGTTTTIASFSNLSDMACFTVSVPLRRWYFKHEVTSQFGGTVETIGFADATFISANQNILLIEDQGGFGGTAGLLNGLGYSVTVVTNEFARGYSNLLNRSFLNGFGLVVYGERGDGVGSVLPANVAASLENYIQGGGNVLVTGYDTLGGPTDTNLANLVRSLNPADDSSMGGAWQLTNLNHFILNGPYGDYRGLSFTATSYDGDFLMADTARGALTLARTPGRSDRIIFTDVTPGGSVGYWNGGVFGTVDAQPDFHDGGIPQNLFLNWVTGVLGRAPVINPPTLKITRSAASVTVSWPLTAAEFQLEESASLPAGPIWNSVMPPFQTNGANISVTVPGPPGNKFYRLHKL